MQLDALFLNDGNAAEHGRLNEDCRKCETLAVSAKEIGQPRAFTAVIVAPEGGGESSISQRWSSQWFGQR